MPMTQLTLDGGEVLHPPRTRRRRAVGEVGATLLALLQERGPQRPVDAGVVVHRLRGGCPDHGSRWGHWTGQRSTACCPYAAVDGYSALRSLEGRGLVGRAEGESAFTAR
jgi:hypothetical protein